MTFEQIKNYVIVNKQPLVIGAVTALVLRAMLR